MKRIILDITGAHRFSSSPLKKLQLHGPRNPNTFPVQTSSPHPQTPKENRDIQKKSKSTEQYNPEQEFSLQSSFGNFICSITYQNRSTQFHELVSTILNITQSLPLVNTSTYQDKRPLYFRRKKITIEKTIINLNLPRLYRE